MIRLSALMESEVFVVFFCLGERFGWEEEGGCFWEVGERSPTFPVLCCAVLCCADLAQVQNRTTKQGHAARVLSRPPDLAFLGLWSVCT